MGTNGWRRLTVMSAAKLQLRGDTIVVQQENETATIPLSQLHTILVANQAESLSTALISRQLAVHGYHPSVGIHHANQKNPYNLSCDLMEPFRFIVDECVFCNPDRELDWDYRRELINLTKKRVKYNGKTMEMDQAIDSFVLDVLAAMKHPQHELGVLENAR